MSVEGMASAKAKQAMLQQSLSYMDKGDYERQSQLSAIGKYMQKHRKGFSFNPNNVWQLAYERNRAKLAIMLSIYLFYNNDNDISVKEEKMLKKIIKREKIFLKDDDRLFLQSLAEKQPTLQTFSEYLEVNEFKQDIFDQAIKTIQKDIKSNDNYKKLLAGLEKHVEDIIKIKE